VPELRRTLSAIPPGTYQYVTCAGLHGTYDDGLVWLKDTSSPGTPSCVLSLGASMGNFSREEAAKFLLQFSKALGSQDSLLIGLDSCPEGERIFRAYNDCEGVTEAFYRNGLKHANHLLGYEGFKQCDWQVVGNFDQEAYCHEAYYTPRRDVDIEGIWITKGTRIHLERAYKYSSEQLTALWHGSGLIHKAAYSNKEGDYSESPRQDKEVIARHRPSDHSCHVTGIHLLSPAIVKFPVKPAEYASRPVPTLKDWQGLWVAWDMVTRSMTPPDGMLSKPIKLRNDLIFYLGHIPGFCGVLNFVNCMFASD
jgi:L-histidine Nalpha-methyltransferase / hercynylcysteine S-oxide synthase